MNEPFQLPSALEICEKVSFGSDFKALAAEYPQAPDFIAALRQKKMNVDAVQALARCLPKEKAVEWASQSARMVGENVGLSSEEKKTLESVDAWISKPESASAAAVASAADDLPADSPAGSAANAAVFAEEINLPEEASLPFTGDDLTGHFAASAVLLSAATMSPEGIPEVEEIPEKPETPKIPEIAELTKLNENPQTAALEKVAEAIPADEMIAKGTEQLAESAPLDVPADQQAQAAEVLEPFIEMGVKLAETLPGWL